MTNIFKLKSAVITLQRLYRNIKLKMKLLHFSINFHNDYLISMIDNLNKNEDKYLLLLNELKIIKSEMENIIYPITFTNYKENFNVCKNINNLLIKYSNYVCPNNIDLVFYLFIYSSWNNVFTKDIELIIFIRKFINIKSVWSSYHHNNDLPVLTEETQDNSNEETQKFMNNFFGNILKNMIINKLQNNDNDNNQKPSIIMLPINEPEMQSSDIPPPLIQIIKANPLIYDLKECKKVLGNNNIILSKDKSNDDVNSVCIYLKYKEEYLVINGNIKDDLLNVADNFEYYKEKYKSFNNIVDKLDEIPTKFRHNYSKIVSVRDIILLNSDEIKELYNNNYNYYKKMNSKNLNTLLSDFNDEELPEQINMLSLLLIGGEDDQDMASIIYDGVKQKNPNYANKIYQSLHHSIRKLLKNSVNKMKDNIEKLTKLTDNDISYEKRISLLNVPEYVKMKALEKHKMVKNSFANDGKAQAWLDGLLQIPFGVYSQNEIINFKKEFIKKLGNDKLFSDTDIEKFIKKKEHKKLWENYNLKKKNYLLDIRKTLDSVVYGHKQTKTQLERLFAQWINGDDKGAIIGLQGPPGTGKTSIVKHGLSKCLKDINGNPRPFAFLPIGGSTNGSTLVGHNFTYQGSTWGRIVDILITSKCMNPIIFIDEVDKVSSTDYGREIISILTHLTDATQNNEFEDKFFAGIKLDLSKALIVFSFNDPELIDPILRDRITIIETKPLSINDKLVIIKDYMLKEICKDIGFNLNEIIIKDETIKYLIETYTYEAGVRKVKEKLVEIIRDINLNRFYNNNYKLPFTITQEYIQKLFEDKPKLKIKKIHSEPMVGVINGLYATGGCGIGGITEIQVTKNLLERKLELNYTGNLGNVMKESIQCAFKVSLNLLSDTQRKKINKNPYGIHVHCPESSTPKDGPSAGVALSIVLYSLLTNIKINNKICMTGEIDLVGNVLAIGGLNAKLNGAKKAGCNLALIPFDNSDDLEIIRRNNESPEDDNFKVILIKNIQQVLDIALVKEDIKY